MARNVFESIAAKAFKAEIMQTTPTSQSPGVFRKKVGDIVVTAILDGMLIAEPSVLQGRDEADIKNDLEAMFRPGKLVLSVSCFVLNIGEKTVMLDTGCGKNEMFVGGRLPEALNAAGISPDSIDTVLISHLHPDHSGGLATEDGRAFFKNADLRLHADEAKFWLEQDTPPEEMRPYFDSAKAAVKPYRQRMSTFTKGDVLPGIAAEHLPGHTPGHSGFLVTSGSDALLLWTDIVHQPALQTAHPEVYIAFDIDPEQATAQRKRIFDKVATDRILVGGPHMEFPTFAHLERRGTGYGIVPEPWRPTL